MGIQKRWQTYESLYIQTCLALENPCFVTWYFEKTVWFQTQLKNINQVKCIISENILSGNFYFNSRDPWPLILDLDPRQLDLKQNDEFVKKCLIYVRKSPEMSGNDIKCHKN